MAQNLAAATALRNGGLAVTSTATPALSGLYACDGLAHDAMQSETNAILLNQTFADGGATLNWPDRAGTPHSFDVAQFHTLVVAIANFIAQCALYSEGVTTTAPAATATIP